jgi:hypothetical protein
MKYEEYISEQEFEQEWGAHVKPNGDLYSREEIQGFPDERVWTVYEDGSVDDLGNEDRTWYASPGYMTIGALGYLVTEKNWTYETSAAIWYLDDADEKEREELRRFNLGLDT